MTTVHEKQNKKNLQKLFSLFLVKFVSIILKLDDVVKGVKMSRTIYIKCLAFT